MRWPRFFPTIPLIAVLTSALFAPASVTAQEIHGFVEFLDGVRSSENAEFERGTHTARETRLQLRVSDYADDAEYFARLDVFHDQIAEDETSLELREAFFTWNGWTALNLKVGRQILTWGTGDLLFINDIFPKDWESFFIGREDQYLKAPMDAARLGFFLGSLSAELVLMPRFEADRLPDPSRLTAFQPLGRPVTPLEPGTNVDEGEVAVRVYRNFGSFDASLYGYRGYYRQPVGIDSAAMAPFYPRLDVVGTSVRGPLLGGIASLEAGVYRSRDDAHGDDPLVENSSVRVLAGHDRQLWTEFQLGLQAYGEWMLDHSAYEAGVAAGSEIRDELRQLFTLRATQMLRYQTVILALFVYGSPSDEDVYLRSSITYRLSDQIELLAGTNFFAGKSRQSFFGQFDANDNIYLRGRYTF